MYVCVEREREIDDDDDEPASSLCMHACMYVCVYVCIQMISERRPDVQTLSFL